MGNLYLWATINTIGQLWQMWGQWAADERDKSGPNSGHRKRGPYASPKMV
jgi:hypothetical protein